ncbi:MAG: YicC family protein [Muribaculaceae bacterium]|nr:YicC family protein [Muribaculaceae bacterium]MDE6093412.1 YicC family protein [Muribaculaceae bacterium]
MVLSMTGFGKVVELLPGKKLTVEMKSLNSKQLDLSVKLPVAFRHLEPKVREAVARKLQRGKVDLGVWVESTGTTVGQPLSTDFDVEVMKTLKGRIEEVSAALGIENPSDWYQVLMRFPDTLRSDVGLAEATEAEEQELILALEKCVDSLMHYRSVEGEKLEVFFASRIERIRNLLAQVPRWESERVAKVKSRLEDNLSKLPKIEYDKGRLEQEMIFYIEKLDINEEKQRLTQHLDYFMETMGGSAPGQGKKLGFIAQEMGREINTLGSKSNHAELQKLVVDMKDELEQIKEQVLNVM